MPREIIVNMAKRLSLVSQRVSLRAGMHKFSIKRRVVLESERTEKYPVLCTVPAEACTESKKEINHKNSV